MRTNIRAIIVVSLVFLFATACKRSQPADEPATEAPAPEQSTTDSAAEAEQPAAEPEAEAPEAEAEPAVELPPDGARTISVIPIGDSMREVSGKTPGGATVKFGVPRDWLEMKTPNESTLLVYMAGQESPVFGTKATLVATEFKGTTAELVEENRVRLKSFAEVKREGPTRIGRLQTYELAASWTTPMGSRDTVQLMMATGKEAIGVTCEMGSGGIETLSALCDEIFATITLKGAKPR